MVAKTIRELKSVSGLKIRFFHKLNRPQKLPTDTITDYVAKFAQSNASIIPVLFSHML